jgi:Uma2 family endonuclease
LTGKPCVVRTAPYDVRLPSGKGGDTVVQPDIVVICDKGKRKSGACVGAPDLVVEILSDSSASYDRVRKFNLYRDSGVKEYWIVDPAGKTVEACMLKDGEYVVRRYGEGDSAPVGILGGLPIALQDIFTEA